MRDIGMLTTYLKSILINTLSLYALLNRIAASIIEELYFCDYLMPRLSRFSRWTPIVETTLFTFYYFWQPYYWISQFFFYLPIMIAV